MDNCVVCGTKLDEDDDCPLCIEEQVMCECCEKYGLPNYEDGKYYCGGSPWCCP